ncbi:hypothetical protein C5167_029260 [Papaver somniferum]|nr:hypothetical protein C5167_029260 [Papaver somniferum]
MGCDTSNFLCYILCVEEVVGDEEDSRVFVHKPENIISYCNFCDYPFDDWKDFCAITWQHAHHYIESLAKVTEDSALCSVPKSFVPCSCVFVPPLQGRVSKLYSRFPGRLGDYGPSSHQKPSYKGCTGRILDGSKPKAVLEVDGNEEESRVFIHIPDNIISHSVTWQHAYHYLLLRRNQTLGRLGDYGSSSHQKPTYKGSTNRIIEKSKAKAVQYLDIHKDKSVRRWLRDCSTRS